MSKQRSYEIILNFIKEGKENGISANALSKLLGLPQRELERMVQKARLDGVIICSSANGYYYPKNNEELASYYKRYHQSAITTLLVLKSTRLELIKKGLNPKEIVGG